MIARTPIIALINADLEHHLSKTMNTVNEPRHEKNQQSAYAKTKTQTSFAVTAKLISAFVFATWIVQYLFFLNTKFQDSSHLQ